MTWSSFRIRRVSVLRAKEVHLYIYLILVVSIETPSGRNRQTWASYVWAYALEGFMPLSFSGQSRKNDVCSAHSFPFFPVRSEFAWLFQQADLYAQYQRPSLLPSLYLPTPHQPKATVSHPLYSSTTLKPSLPACPQRPTSSSTLGDQEIWGGKAYGIYWDLRRYVRVGRRWPDGGWMISRSRRSWMKA